MHFERIADVMKFYQEVLGFRLSDYWRGRSRRYFFHVNPRHQSIAFVESGINMVHHMMVELSASTTSARATISRSPNRRSRRHARAPFGRLRHVVLHLEPVGLPGRIRLGRAGDRRQQLDAVRAQVRPELLGPRAALDVGGETEKSRLLVHRGGRNGQRMPVQVIDGNYNCMPGVCPWWDDEAGSGSAG